MLMTYVLSLKMPGPACGQPFAEGEAELPVRPREVSEMFIVGWAGNSTDRGGFALDPR
jgi:hypothetical protein